MSVSLRDYQETAVRALRNAYAGGARAPLFVLPTGGGKTITFAYIAASAVDRGRRVLVLAHRQELLRQISSALRLFDVDHGLVMPGCRSIEHDALVASVQTLVRRLHKFRWDPDLIIIDEAHHAVAGSWRKIIERWPDVPLLGVTATPQRLDGKGLGVLAGGAFDALVEGPTVQDLVRDGHLTPNRIFAPPNTFDRKSLKKRGGDFRKGDIEKEMDKPTITGDAIAHYQKHGEGRPAIAFCATVVHAKHTRDAFISAGIPAESLDGSLDDDERASRIAHLTNGETKVLTSCEIVSEGFDLPAVTVAILLRPTASESLYLQQVGRCLRPAPGKTHALILDHVGNTLVHGLPEEERQWSLGGRSKKKGKGGLAPPVKQCDACYAVFTPRPVCPACGHILPIFSREIEEVDGELQELTDQDKWKMQINRKREEGTCQTLQQLEALGRKRGYKPGWAQHRWAARVRKMAGGFYAR